MTSPLPPVVAGPSDPNHVDGHNKLRAALAELQARITTVASLPSPLVIAHRGGGQDTGPNGKGPHPESTIEGYRAAAAEGATILEQDCYLLRDGAFAVMHDPTIDRTTTGTGNISDHTAASVQTLAVDAGTWYAPSWPNTLKVPLFSDLMREFGGKVVLCPEVKNTGGGTILAAKVRANGLTASVLAQTGLQTEIAPLVAAGIATAWLDPSGAALTPAQIVATGATYVFVDFTVVTQATVTALKAAGLKVVAYVIDRRKDVATWLAMGGDGYFTNEPVYAPQLQAAKATDAFALQTYPHGMIGGNAGVRGQFTAPTWWGMTDNVAQHSALMGDMSPIKNNPAASAFTITGTAVFDSWSAATGFVQFLVCAQDDTLWIDGTAPGPNGYVCLFRPNGNLSIYRCDNGVSTLLSNNALTVPTAGVPFTWTITVSATQIQWSTSLNATKTTTNDTSYRGGYWHIGRKQVALRVGGITIT